MGKIMNDDAKWARLVAILHVVSEVGFVYDRGSYFVSRFHESCFLNANSTIVDLCLLSISIRLYALLIYKTILMNVDVEKVVLIL